MRRSRKDGADVKVGQELDKRILTGEETVIWAKAVEAKAAKATIVAVNFIVVMMR